MKLMKDTLVIVAVIAVFWYLNTLIVNLFLIQIALGVILGGFELIYYKKTGKHTFVHRMLVNK